MTSAPAPSLSALSGGSFSLAEASLVADVWFFTSDLDLLLPDDSSSGNSLPFSLFLCSGIMEAAVEATMLEHVWQSPSHLI